MPFYYVQIAPHHYSKSKNGEVQNTEFTEPEFREAQTCRAKNTAYRYDHYYRSE
jgi:hypothetical protein